MASAILPDSVNHVQETHAFAGITAAADGINVMINSIARKLVFGSYDNSSGTSCQTQDM